MDKQNEARWVAERLAAVQPQWTADVAQARMRLDAFGASSKHRRVPWAPVAVACAIAVVAIVLPQGRGLAQELWYRLLATRVDVVRLNLSDIPLESRTITNGLQQRAASIDDAGRMAGFRPNLPSSHGLLGLTVTGPVSVTQTVRVAKLNAALEKAGALDVLAPSEWEGATVRAEISPMVLAYYAGNVQVAQAKPVVMFAPAGIPLDRLAEAVLRSVGLPWLEARTMARRFAADPALMVGIPADASANVREVTVRGRVGLLVEDLDERGSSERASVMFSGPDRMYAVRSPTAAESLRIAEMLP
jgi:hypothetical protein